MSAVRLQVGRLIRSAAILVLALVAGSTRAATAETGTVLAVLDGDTIKVSLENGPRKVRLLGIDTPEPPRDGRAAEPGADRATAFTRRLVEGQLVVLETDALADDEDRYDRALRYVFLPDGRLLNAALVAEGLAHVYTRSTCSRMTELLQLEREARDAGRGMWSPEGIRGIELESVGSAVGSVATVCGPVASTRYAEGSEGRPTFLNLGRPHPDQALAIVIWGAVRGAFGGPESRYADRRVCVTGRIRLYRGKPEIVVSDPTQIRDGTASQTGVSVPG
jgi:micrococcal nuclease